MSVDMNPRKKKLAKNYATIKMCHSNWTLNNNECAHLDSPSSNLMKKSHIH